MVHAVDSFNCPVGPELEFLQEKMAAGAAATTLRVYVAAITARRELDEILLGRHRMVSAFMRGIRRLGPVRPIGVPSWDLSVESRMDSDSQGYSFVGTNVIEESWGFAGSLCQRDVYGLRPGSGQGDPVA